MVTTDMLALREAAMAGVGVVQLPLLMVRDQLASGELEVVLDEWQPRREVIHAVFASRRGLLPSVRALVDFINHRQRHNALTAIFDCRQLFVIDRYSVHFRPPQCITGMSGIPSF